MIREPFDVLCMMKYYGGHNHLDILCSFTKIKLSIPVDIVFICCKKTKTQ